MKSSALTVLFLIFLSALSLASQGPEGDTPDCRKYVFNTGLNFTSSQLIWHDLTSGLWTQSQADGSERRFQFNESGQADIFEADAQGQLSYESVNWRVEETAGRVFLLIDNGREANEAFFRVKQTCDGIVLLDLESMEEEAMTYLPFESAKRIGVLNEHLLGEWTNIGPALEDGASGLKFKADGTYCQLGKAGAQGKWEISKDGQHLVLRPVCEKPGEFTLPVTYQIKELDGHGLIMMACGSKDTLAFIK